MKKKIYSTLILAAAALLFVPSAVQADTWDGTIPAANASATFGGGDGTSATPYLISTCADLAQLAANVNGGENYTGIYFKQTADLDLDGKEWTPIGTLITTRYALTTNDHPFEGNYDGDDKTIDKLKIVSSDVEAQRKALGLFGFINEGASVKNLVLKNVDLLTSLVNMGSSNVYMGIGSCIGTVYGACTVENVHVLSGTIKTKLTNQQEYIGGVVGVVYPKNDATVITKLTNGANLETKTSVYGRVGGCVGCSYSSVSNCVNTGSITSLGITGGVVGHIAQSGTSVTNSLNAGYIYTGRKTYTGGIAGQGVCSKCVNVNAVNANDARPITSSASSNNFCDKQMCPNTTINTTATMTLTSDMLGTKLNGTLGTDWVYTNGLYPYPAVLPLNDVVKTAIAPLVPYHDASETINKFYSPLTYAETSAGSTPMTWTSSNATFAMNSGAANFTVGGESDITCGVNGTQKIIKLSYEPTLEVWTVAQWTDLATKVNAGGGSYTFTRGEGGESFSTVLHANAADQIIQVKANLDFENANVTVMTANFKGTLQGNGYTFSNFVIPNANAHRGLIAILAGGTIDHLNVCNVTANVTSQTNATHGLGGLVGCTTGTVKGNITNCAVSGNLTGKQFVGGIIGIAEGTQYVNVENCCFVGKIAGTSQSASQAFAGGIIGKAAQAGTTIKNCLSGALIEGVAYSGGISGGGAGTVQNCLFVGQALSSGYNGSIAPVLDASGLTNNFYDDQMATVKGHGSTVAETGKAEGKLTSQLLGSAGAGLLGSGWTSIGTNAYPVPTGMETTDVALTIAAPLNLYKETYSDAGTTKTYVETYDKVNAPYTFATSIGGKTVARTTSNVAFPLDDTGKGVTPADGTGTADLTFSIGCPVKYLKVEYTYVPLEVWAPDDWTGLTSAANKGGGVYTYKKDGTGEDVTPYLNKNAVKINPQTINVMADLDFEAAAIAPLGRVSGTSDFQGILKGNNHTFSNFVIDVNGADYGVGLIGIANSATIDSLHICGATINGTSSWAYAGTGALVGYSSLAGTTNITNCTASAVVTGSVHAGGLVGTGFAGAFNINNCSFVGKVTTTGAYYVGGIMGISQVGSTINKCMSGGLVKGAKAGGIIGGSMATSNVSNCLVVGQVVGTSSRGGISSLGTTLTNNYYDKQICVAGGKAGTDVTGQAEGKLTSELLGTAGQALLGADWTNIDEGAYPVPTAISTTAVALTNAAPLKLFNGTIDGETVTETAEGISNPYTYATSVNGETATWACTTTALPFDGSGTGTPNGSGEGHITVSIGCPVKYISVPAYARIEVWDADDWKNLTDIVNAEEKAVYTYTPTTGSFAGTEQSSLVLPNVTSQNVHIMADVDFTGRTSIPMGRTISNGFAGKLQGHGYTFSNMTISDNTDGVGLLGYVKYATVKNMNLCGMNVTNAATTATYGTGMLVGSSYAFSVTIDSCSASGIVNAASAAGGLVGVSGSPSTSISNSSVVGKITSTGIGVGGIGGYATGKFVNCLSAMQLSGSNNVGGIVGFGTANTKISNCLNVGQVATTGANKGAIVSVAAATLSNNYYDRQMCAAGGVANADVAGKAEGFTTANLLGDKLKTALGETNWTYTEGYYPVPTVVDTFAATQLASVPVRQFITADGLKDANADYIANGSDRPYYKYQTTDAFKRPALLVKTTADGTEIEDWASSGTSLVVDENTTTVDGNKYLASPVRQVTDKQATLTATLGCAARYVNVTIPALAEAKDGDEITAMAAESDYTVWQGGQITATAPSLAAGKEITYKRIFDLQDASGVAGNNTATLAMPFPVQSITTDDYADMVTYVLRPASKANSTQGHFSMWYLKAGTTTDAVAADDGFRNARWKDDFTFNADGSVVTYNGGTAFDWTKTPVHLAFSTDYFNGRPVEFHYVNETTSPYTIIGAFDEANYTGGTPRYYYYRGNHSMADKTLSNNGAYLLNPYTGFFELNTHAQTISAFEAYVQSFGTAQTRVAFAYGEEGGSTDIADETVATGTNQLTVWREGGNLFVRSTVAQTVAVVSTSGQTVAAWSLAEGETQSIQLPAAVYVVKGSRNGTVKVAM